MTVFIVVLSNHRDRGVQQRSVTTICMSYHMTEALWTQYLCCVLHGLYILTSCVTLGDIGVHWASQSLSLGLSWSLGSPATTTLFFNFAGIHVKQEDNNLGSLPVSYCVESARMPKANAAYFWSNQRNWDLKRRPLKIYFKWKTVTCGVWSSAF